MSAATTVDLRKPPISAKGSEGTLARSITVFAKSIGAEPTVVLRGLDSCGMTLSPDKGQRTAARVLASMLPRGTI